MSLADELLADLEEDEVAEVEPEQEDIVDEITDVQDAAMEIDTQGANSVRSIAKLRDSEILQDVMDKIEFFSTKGKRDVIGPVESDPEYMLIVEANNLTNEIDNEINIIHKFVRDRYQKRFPELESLVQLPVDYMRTVKELGNTIVTNLNISTTLLLGDFKSAETMMLNMPFTCKISK